MAHAIYLMICILFSGVLLRWQGISPFELFDTPLLWFACFAGLAHLVLWPRTLWPAFWRWFRHESLSDMECRALQQHVSFVARNGLNACILLMLLGGFFALEAVATDNQMVSLGQFLAITILGALGYLMLYWWGLQPLIQALEKQKNLQK